MSAPRIVVAGAGAVGCFVGGLLAAAGREVVFLGRGRMLAELEVNGVAVSDFAGLKAKVAPVMCSSDPAVLADADLVLVCVKSGATSEMAGLIARHAPADAVVVSLQNGLSNAEALGLVLVGRDVRAGMVGFNVVPLGAGRFHRSTSGEIVIEAGPGAVAEGLRVPGLAIRESRDIAAVQWGKLLINLNNAVNALSGMALKDMLMRRDWRRVMADQMAEGLAVLKVAGITATPPAPVPGWVIPHILRLPTPLFRRIAGSMLTVDPHARTSMAEDLAQGRHTEIDALQGEIVRLGEVHRVATPICAHVAGLICAAEAGGGAPAAGAEVLRP